MQNLLIKLAKHSFKVQQIVTIVVRIIARYSKTHHAP